MTDKKIADLTDLSPLQPGDSLETERAGVSGRVSGSSLIAAVNVSRPIVFNRNGGGSVIATGAGVESFHINYAGAITKVVLLGDQAGSVSIDIWNTNAGLPSAGNKISGTDPATLTSASYGAKTSFTGWTTAVSPNDVLKINVASVSTLTWLGVEIWIQPS